MPERFIDASNLPAPEPLGVTLCAAMALRLGEGLRVRLPHEPYPLYELLALHGFHYQSTPVLRGDDILCDVLITKISADTPYTP